MILLKSWSIEYISIEMFLEPVEWITEWSLQTLSKNNRSNVFTSPLSIGITSSSTCHARVTELRKQMESSELKNQRLKEVFQRKIQEFRTVCYILTGYQMDITTENQYRLTSVYAEHMDDSLLFKKVGTGRPLVFLWCKTGRNYVCLF